jgi:alkanesulfonate monooxygenase SsuD/methylene tetrahydromethanopterin reductase-like flavin-dependent oxidoreductase (luciferase family)
MPTTPLVVLDLLPRSSGSTPAQALANTIDLAQQTERQGYRRYWFAEHHLNPGVLGSSPAVAIALVAGATSTIRLGSAGVQFGHRTPLAAVEEFGLIDALYPGRLDLGIGRSIGRSAPTGPTPVPEPARADHHRQPSSVGGGGQPSDREPVAAAAARYLAGSGAKEHDSDQRTPNGLLLPKKFDFTKLISSGRFEVTLSLLQQPNAYTPDYGEQIDDVLALLAGTYRSRGLEAHAAPGEGAEVELWILGASGGSSATVAGERGLRFAASYHHSPSTVLDAVDAYRQAFRPSAELDRPYVSVSADVVVAEDDDSAVWLASGYGLWVRSIRRGEGAIAFPTPEEAAGHAWTDEDRELVQDRVATQLVGSPGTVADRLEQLRDATGADELAITTITHDHADRVRSYELLAREWERRQS